MNFKLRITRIHITQIFAKPYNRVIQGPCVYHYMLILFSYEIHYRSSIETSIQHQHIDFPFQNT